MTILLINFPGTETSVSDAVVITALILGTIKVVREVSKLGPKQAWVAFKDWIKERRSKQIMLNTILAELRPNGGSSLKDVVLRIESDILSMKPKIEHIQARVRHIDDVAKAAIFELDNEGNMTYANRAFRELVGATESQLYGKAYISRIQASRRRGVEDEIDQSIENCAPIDSEVPFISDGKGYVHVRLEATPNTLPDGSLNAFFGTAVGPEHTSTNLSITGQVTVEQ